jgi:hypothetical protein
MPLDFPSTPAPNETYSFGGSVWKWNGSVWKIVSGTTQFDYVESFNGRTGAVQGVSAAVGGVGISVSGATGTVTITNTGVQSVGGQTGAVSYIDFGSL